MFLLGGSYFNQFFEGLNLVTMSKGCQLLQGCQFTLVNPGRVLTINGFTNGGRFLNLQGLTPLLPS